MLRNKWKETNYSLVMNKVDLMDGWPESNNSLKGALLSWMVENKEEVLIEEGEDILDGIETQLKLSLPL